MNTIAENDILFDDVALLESKLGKGQLQIISRNLGSDCDCASYTDLDDCEQEEARVTDNVNPYRHFKPYGDCNN